MPDEQPDLRTIAQERIADYRLRHGDSSEMERAAATLAIEALADDPDRHVAILVLSEMVDRYGFEDVQRWLRNIGTMLGRSL